MADFPIYKDVMDNAIPGLLFGTNEHVVLTRRADVDIAFGSPLYGKSGDGNSVVVVNDGGTLTFLGIAAFVQNTAGYYLTDDAVSVVHKGYIYVKTTEAVKANGKVYVDKTNGAFLADVGSNGVEVPGALYLADGTANSVVPVLLG